MQCLRAGSGLRLLVVLGCSQPGDLHDAGVPEWHLSSASDLVIGSENAPETTFGRIGSLATLATGEIAVQDAQATVIRVFGPDGAYRRTIARRGEGPGEFQLMGWMQAVGDSLLVRDLRTGAVTVLGADGTHHRRVVVEPDPVHGPLELVRRLRNGAWLGAAVEPFQSPAMAGLGRNVITYGLLQSTDAPALSPIARVAGEAYVLLPETRTFSFARFHLPAVPVAVGDTPVIIESDSARVWVQNEPGSPPRHFSIPIPRREITEALRAQSLFRDRERSRSPGERDRWDLIYAAEPRPRFIPPVSRALVDGEHLLWMEEYALLEDAPLRYWIVDLHGAVYATVLAPPGFRILEVGGNWVLGLQEDPDGVQRVMRYGLERR